MKQWPIRRDVRDMLLAIGRLFERNGFIEVDGDILTPEEAIDEPDYEILPYVDFNREMLTEIRDLMRDGVSLGDALLAVANAEETPEPASDFVPGPGEYTGPRGVYDPPYIF